VVSSVAKKGSASMSMASRIGCEAAVRRVVEANRQERRQTRTALAYPSLVCGLAALGIWWLGSSGFPHEGLIVSAAGPAAADRMIPTGWFLRSIGWPAAGGCAAVVVATVAWWWAARKRPRQSGRHEALACAARAAATVAGLPADALTRGDVAAAAAAAARLGKRAFQRNARYPTAAGR
jgi:hypothetical protein